MANVANAYPIYYIINNTTEQWDSYGITGATSRLAVPSKSSAYDVSITYYDYKGYDGTQWVYWSDTVSTTLNPTNTTPTAAGAITNVEIFGVRTVTNSFLSDNTPAPAFQYGPTVYAYQNTALNLAPYVAVTDMDVAQTLTWAQYTAPAHGSLTVTSATATSGSSNIGPGGTLTYTPSTGYTGSDSCVISVNDGINTLLIPLSIQVVATGTGDPYWNNVIVYYQFNTTTHGSNQILELKTNAYAPTPCGAYLSTSIFKYGTSSLSGVNHSVSYTLTGPRLPSLTSLNLTGDFTVEAWVYVMSQPTSYPLVGGHAANGTPKVILDLSGTGDLTVYDGSINYTVTTPYTWTFNTWHYVAFSRTSNALSFYVDGNLIGSPIVMSTPLNLYGGTVASASTTGFLGFIDELRISNIGRYTGATMTVPTGESTPY